MKRFLIVVALCTVCTAFLPLEMERIALNAKEEEANSSSTAATTIICLPETPCAWIPYNPVNRVLNKLVENTYCICDEDKGCKALQDDRVRGVYTLYCRDKNYDDSELLDS